MNTEPRPFTPCGPMAPAQADALARLALSTAQGRGAELYASLVHELAHALDVPLVLLAIHAQDERDQLRTLAVSLDGQAVPEFSFPLRLVADAAAPHASGLIGPSPVVDLPPESPFAGERMQGLAALPLHDGTGESMGFLVAMDRRPLRWSDSTPAECMLRVAAARAAAEIERDRTDETLRSVALAVWASRTGCVFDELVRLLASILRVDVAFVALPDPACAGGMRALAMYIDGQVMQDVRYPLAGSPCATVLGQSFRAYPTQVQARFPEDRELRDLGSDGYAGHPLVGLDGSPLGIVSVASRHPLTHLDRVKATLKIFSVRAAAEVERMRADEAQKQALEDLRQREAQYRAIFESSLDALFLWNEELRIVDVNPAGLALYGGYTREQMVGQTYPDTMPADYVRDRLDMVRWALDGHTTHVETTVLRPDGSSFEADLRVMPFLHRGRPHALAALRDISERRLRERELRRSEEQYRAIFNASADALVLRDADFRIVDANATYEQWSGYTRAEVLGMDRVFANPPEVASTIRELHREALAGAAVRLETQLRHRDGHTRESELRGVRILHRGRPHVLYIGRDITQARLAEQARRDSEEQYRAIFDASSDALLLRDADFRVVEVNPAYLAMSGYTREEVVAADRVLTLVDPEVRGRHRRGHALALAGKNQCFELVATRKDGTQLRAEVRGTPMTYRGRPHVLYAIRDITERVAAEQRRAELERQLLQAQKMQAIGQLTGGLAHDFNNILTSVLGYLGMAQERPAASLDATLAAQLAHARVAAERAREHVAQLLAFSRPRRGERRRLAPAEVTAEVLQLLRPNLPTSIDVECAQSPHGKAGVPGVLADPVQLEQVLLNLCINARDAIGDQGTIRLRTLHAAGAGHCASCTARVDGRWVVFEVGDNGCGMPPDVVDRMFEPFFTTKEVGRGTGMGLAMVHGIVHDHGGHVQVTTAPGQGSTFRVLLPAAAAERAGRAAPAARVPRAGAALPALRGRVLLVEDESIVSGFMQDLMRGWGLEVVLERDPLAAARRLAVAEEAFALLLTDQTMPGMTGLALARQAHAQRPAMPVVLYTGNAFDIGEQDLADCGIAVLLRKPIDGAALRPVITRLLAPQEHAGA